ncbi:MAG: hypothetical protein KJ574_02940, partial [Nanoarchaeota archaeon]|nr:hypothetical protein [Nanoarchaeota archaeon]
MKINPDQPFISAEVIDTILSDEVQEQYQHLGLLVKADICKVPTHSDVMGSYVPRSSLETMMASERVPKDVKRGVHSILQQPGQIYNIGVAAERAGKGYEALYQMPNSRVNLNGDKRNGRSARGKKKNKEESVPWCAVTEFFNRLRCH